MSNAETSTAIITAMNDSDKQIVEVPKKKRGSASLFRVALYMVRGKSNGGKKKPVVPVDEVAPKGMWKKFVGSMRPLHLQDSNNGSPKRTLTATNVPESPMVEDYEDVFPPPMSPNGPFAPMSPSSCSDGMSSRYASAVNLQELDKSDDNVVDVIKEEEDETIDAKADEFIARFYEQMRLQRLDSINIRYNEMNARALG